MKLSIIIPSYNADKHIYDMLNSLLAQGFNDTDYEILVIDDGSSVPLKPLYEYCNRHKNIRIMEVAHGGASKARNHGIREARGEYLCFCDADDLVIENSLCDVYDAAHDQKLDMLFYNRFITHERNLSRQHSPESYINEKIVRGKDFYGKHPRMPTGPWHYLIRTDFVREHKLCFPEGIACVEDVLFLYDALIVAERVSGIDKDVYLWIERNESVSHVRERQKVIDKCDYWLAVIQKECDILHDETNVQFAKAIRSRLYSHCFILLYNSFVFLYQEDRKRYVKQLRQLGCYPFEYGEYFYKDAKLKYRILHWVMNRYWLWMICCLGMSLVRIIRRK